MTLAPRAARTSLPAALAAVAVLAATAGALPAAAEDGRDATQSLLDAERALQESVAARGEREGLLAHLAESAVTLRPRPAPARAWYAGRAGEATRLRFEPDLAAVSGDGEFGWTSGPWMAWPGPTGERHSSAGYYLTAWRRDADGRWRVVLESRAPYPVTDSARSGHLAVVVREREPGDGRGRAEDCSAAFAAAWREDGRAEALDDYAARDLRLLQTGNPPLDGAKAARRGDALREASLAAHRVSRSLASAGGDLVITYGEYELAARPDVPRQRLVYVQAWDVTRSCRLAAELVVPAGG